MFERFTDRARRIVVLAQDESRALDHDYIGTEHILLGLLRLGEGPAYQALSSEGVELDAVREQVVEHVGRGAKPPAGHIPFTPRAKKVLELALREALQLGDNFIGSEHVLLGLLREGEGLACRIIAEGGTDLGAVRSRLLTVVGRRGPLTPPERGGRAGRVWQSLTAPLRGGPAPPGPAPDQTPVLRRFTPAAWRVTLLAQSEALRLGGTAAGPEHLLLGILAEEEGRGAQALASAAGLDLDEARRRIAGLVGAPEPVEPPPVEPGFSPGGLDVLEFALVEALARGRNGIDTEDLLLGLVRQAEAGDAMPRLALDLFGTSADAVRAAVAALDGD
jgi:ATP-dependent Clp protease ATP-binding subunit ClpA